MIQTDRGSVRVEEDNHFFSRKPHRLSDFFGVGERPGVG